MDKFKTLTEAQAAHEEYGGILLVLDDGEYAHCHFCEKDELCGECGRTAEWLDSLAPSWSEASPENIRRDPRNRTAMQEGLKIAQVQLPL